ncbi:hypothetical protein N474_16290 [Pseudoalteromonas luteoviolacea CPMOR-2]|uniref:hypothetical protein n=1 Tax=Pseudoalteromonas luteoviolacea TaxID=43657 RepID=UPI0007B06681|nr:hypothetical protein [Pseudoalteromonas luteoviolacea]KZN55029.1 hypothetical protein N474_16290 [Pseudoalteromonas luteoviolacea CPMOR-2]
MSLEPDYASYSYEDLLDFFENIDRESFPELYNKVARLLGKDIRAEVLADDTIEVVEEKTVVRSELAKAVKAKRINDYFDSLSDSGSELYTGECDAESYSDDGSGD